MESHPVTYGDLAGLRHQLLRILDRLDNRRVPHLGPAARIKDLVNAQQVPRHIGALMRVVLEVRNAAEYENLEPTAAEGQAVRSAFQAILDWDARRPQPEIAA
jgi:hypothetical protein